MWRRRGTESHLSNLSGLRADWGLWGFVLLSTQHCLVGPCGGIKVQRRRALAPGKQFKRGPRNSITKLNLIFMHIIKIDIKVYYIKYPELD